jgi:SagB-type dehydrogenase family enzyme
MHAKPPFSLGLLLHDIYGINRIQFQEETGQEMPEEMIPASTPPSSRYRSYLNRMVASGGALFPCELYILVSPGQELAAGLYHYDPAHHVLDLLYDGNVTPMLLNTLDQPPESQPAYMLLFSSLFWKDAFKYQEFSYRLQGLDIGCLLAQTQTVAGFYDLRSMLHFCFLDRQLNQLLGLEYLEESVYAVITLEEDLSHGTRDMRLQNEPNIFATGEFSGPPKTLERYDLISRWPLLEAVHRASCIEKWEDVQARQTLPPLLSPAQESNLGIKLPSVEYTHQRTHATRRRSAQPEQFRPRQLTLQQLALLLHTAQQGYQGDLDGEVPHLAHTLLYCMIMHVEDVPPGIYAYQAERHLLRQVHSREFLQVFHRAQYYLQPSVYNLSLCIIPAGNYARGFSVYGDRWYRLQNMEAGMMVQRLYLAAAMSNLGCRASLGYNDELIDKLLDLPSDYTGLIQIFIAPLDPTPYDCERHQQMINW